MRAKTTGLRQAGAWIAVWGALCVSAAGCGAKAGGTEPVDDGFDRAAMLTHIGERVVRPEVSAFAQRAGALATAASAWCAAAQGGGTPDASARLQAQQAAQSAWKAAMVRWQRLEVLRIGPAAMNDGELRDKIYSWPVVSACAVDQAVALRHADPASVDVAKALPNRRGLDALEALLFRADTAHACSPVAAPKGWDQLDEDSRWQARACYAAAAAADLQASGDTLSDAWKVGGGDYAAVLKGAGGSGNPWSSQREALNALSDTLFYLDAEVKGMKLGQPAGKVANSCGTADAPCAKELESPWAKHGKVNVVENLRAFEALLFGIGSDGVEGVSFDDWLVKVGAQALADKLRADTAALRKAVDAIPGALGTAIEDEAGRAKVTEAWAAGKEVSATLKSQFLTTLSLDLPDAAAADND